MRKDRAGTRAWLGAAVRVRRRTLLGGVALGGVLVVALGLAGVIGLAPPPQQRPDGATRALSATQPELRRGLLESGDLPAGYTPGPVAGRPPGAAGGAAPARSDSGTPDSGAPGSPEGDLVDTAPGCRTLFERPWDVAVDRDPGARPEVAEHADPVREVLLHQTLGGFDSDGATRALAHLRETAAACPKLRATLDGGTAVTVVLQGPAEASTGVSPGAVAGVLGGGGADESYAVPFTATGGGRTWTGYLAFDRVGRVLSVLRHFGPAGTLTPDEIAETRAAAVDKARPLAEELLTPGP